MHKIGLHNPTEQTLKVLTAIVLCVSHQHHDPPEQKFDVLMQIKVERVLVTPPPDWWDHRGFPFVAIWF